MNTTIPRMQTSEIISFQNVYKRYEKSENYAVENLSLTICKGDFFALLGPNGAGKTTTLHMLIGALKPTKGIILVKNKDIHEETAVKKIIGFVPAEPSFYPKNTTPQQLFDLKRELIGLTKDEMQDFVTEKGEKYQALSLFNRKISSLSTGERQKIGFIIAMMGRPEILVLDESFSHIDPLNRRRIFEDLEKQRKQQLTIIFSTHTLSELENYGEKIGIINQGRLLISISKKELIEKYNPRVIDITVKEKDEFVKALSERGIDYYLEEPLIHVRYKSLDEVSREIIQIACENDFTIYSLKPSQISLEKLITDFFEMEKVKE